GDGAGALERVAGLRWRGKRAGETCVCLGSLAHVPERHRPEEHGARDSVRDFVIDPDRVGQRSGGPRAAVEERGGGEEGAKVHVQPTLDIPRILDYSPEVSHHEAKALARERTGDG